MNLKLKIIVLCLAVAIALPAGSGLAQTVVNGELGIDLQNIGYNSDLKDTVREYSTSRTMSNHFFNLSASGPFINSNLASFSTRANFFGTYYSATNNDDEKNIYFDPNLNGYVGQLTFFPSRRYPVQLFRSRAETYSVRYEPNNRTDVEVLQPGLTVVRRYQSDKTSNGAQSRVTLSDKANMLVGYQQDKTEAFRDYDFGEDRDIWVNFAGGFDDPIAEYATVKLVNELVDADVRVYFFDADSTITIAAMSEDSIVVPAGRQQVYVIPLQIYNQYAFRVEVKQEMIWSIKYEEPPTPNDLDQTSTSARFGLDIGDVDGARNETFYTYNDLSESEQKLTTYMNSLSNTATVPLSRSDELSFMTTFDKNQTQIDTLPKQSMRSFLHMSTYNHAPRRGLAAMFMHSYNNAYSDPGADPVTSQVHTLTNTLGYPSRRLHHRIDMKNNATLLKDDKGYRNNQYSTVLTNRIEYDWLGVRLEPRHELKLSLNKQKGPDKTSREVESKMRVRGDVIRTSVLGDVKFNAEYAYRRKSDNVGADIKGRYVFDLTVSKKFSKDYKLSLMSIQEYETFGGLSTTPSEYKSSYRIAGQASVHADLFMTSSFMLISQKTATIKKFLISANFTVPVVRLPVKSYLTSEARDLSGLETQTITSMVTKFSFQLRQVSVVFAHSYTRENVIVSKYSYHQVEGKISRHFGIM